MNTIERVPDRPTQNCWWCTLLAFLVIASPTVGLFVWWFAAVSRS